MARITTISITNIRPVLIDISTKEEKKYLYKGYDISYEIIINNNILKSEIFMPEKDSSVGGFFDNCYKFIFASLNKEYSE